MLETVVGIVAVAVGILTVLVMIRNARRPQPVVVTNPSTPAVPHAASHRMVRNLIDELEANNEMLQHLKFATAPALRDEMWAAAASENIPEISDMLRTQLNNCYVQIRGAKEIHQYLQSVPLKPDGSAFDTGPEMNEMYRKLEEAKQGILGIIKQLRDLL